MDESFQVASLTKLPAAQQKFQLAWANQLEKQWLENEMKKLGRQRMNLTVMKEAKFLLLKTEAGKIIGWAGLDNHYNPKYPEFFSLHLDPAFRKFGLGLFMESVRASYLLSQNIRYAYVRMAKDSTYRLLMKRLESKFYVEMDRKDLDPEYLGLCQKCNLFDQACREQVFLKFDAEKFLRHVGLMFGSIDLKTLPLKFCLSKPIAST